MMDKTPKPVIVTGIKPTGEPHLGNYLGAIRPALKLAESGEAYFFIADYHALNQAIEPAELRASTRAVAAAYLASGLNPATTPIYRQSDVPEVFELSVLLSSLTPKGLLNRSHAYKAAVERNREAGIAELDSDVNAGLFTYPVLMAADILVLNAAQVPVGKDQRAHVEIAAELAGKFNHRYPGEFRFAVPEAVHGNAVVATLPGLDGRKMSKSYANTIPLFDSAKALRKACMSIVTDSTPLAEPKDLGATTVGQLLAQVAPRATYAELAARMAQGGVGYGEAKQVLFEALDALAAPLREHYAELVAPTSELDEILRIGASRARARAGQTMAAVRRAIGIG